VSETTSPSHLQKLPALDGWRAVSIVLVLASHNIPLGGGDLQFNGLVGIIGMALFFTLSGFLITSTLYYSPSVRSFFIRRLCRIVPLSWLFIAITLTYLHADLRVWAAHLFFYSNLPPFPLTELTDHLWSLCIEVQFYVFIGLLFLLLRRRALQLLPLVCIAVTIGRMIAGARLSIVTWYRVDEILAGASLAVLLHCAYSDRVRAVLARIPPLLPIVVLLLNAPFHQIGYVRPYCAAMLVGITLCRGELRLTRWLESPRLTYLATISYALYVWHPLFLHGWFYSASKLVKYERRPLAILLALLTAHISTFYYERFWIDLGKKWTRGGIRSNRETGALKAIHE
jgi:peptidoglycan/LPS O-acetylase OafA/YrhL